MKTDNKLIGAGLLTAIAASLCCITPVLALIAGTSGLASTFSWLEPFRPYFIGLTILVLGFAWYQKLKPQKKIDCNCDTTEKPKFYANKIIFRNYYCIGGFTCYAFPILTIQHLSTQRQKSKSIVLTQTSKCAKSGIYN
jgi:mercuric ion transport protein